MSEKLRQQIFGLANSNKGSIKTQQMFIERLNSGKPLTRDEGETEHFTLFIMAIDSENEQVYIGHHKKSDLWIPHGGHIDVGETLEETLVREVQEEWGLEITSDKFEEPTLLTITKINNPKIQSRCTKHFDIWYFYETNQYQFNIPPDVLKIEFHEARWMSIHEARDIVTDKSVNKAFDLIEVKYFKNLL